jgi:hypothetical protein
MHVAEEEPQCVPQFFSELSFLFPPFFLTIIRRSGTYSTLKISERGIEQMRTTNYLFNSIII